MNCSSCGANLPPGAAACPLCGTPTPYNAQRSGSSPQYDPTAGASPYGTPGNPQQIDPTEAAPRYDYGAGGTPPPSTGYGTPSQNQYNPANAYGSAEQQYSYGAPPPPNSYGAPPQQGGYGQPGQPGYLPPGQGGYGMQAPPPRRRSRVGLIIGIVVGVLALLCIGGCAILYAAGRSGVNTVDATATSVAATATASSNATPTTNNVTPAVGGGTPPSGLSIDPTATDIIKNVQMASEVDTNNATPTKLASTFTVQQTVYATVELNLNGQTGYAQAKWYGNGNLVHTSKVLEINKPDFTNAYFSFAYDSSTQGAIEIYWCTQKDCSDAKLAQVTNFTVTSTSIHWVGQPVAVLTDLYNKEI